MSIAIHVHDKDPGALAELIARTMRPEDGVVLDKEPQVAHFSALVAAEDRDAHRRRAAWHWLNSISPTVDRDNDWSGL